MRIKLYLDEDSMDNDLTQALRVRGVDVLTAHDLGLLRAPDAEHLAAATADGRTLYSFNVGDYMELHTAYLAAGKEHAGIILAQQQRYGVGEQMRRLVRLVSLRSAEKMRNSIEFLSAWR